MTCMMRSLAARSAGWLSRGRSVVRALRLVLREQKRLAEARHRRLSSAAAASALLLVAESARCACDVLVLECVPCCAQRQTAVTARQSSNQDLGPARYHACLQAEALLTVPSGEPCGARGTGEMTPCECDDRNLENKPRSTFLPRGEKSDPRRGARSDAPNGTRGWGDPTIPIHHARAPPELSGWVCGDAQTHTQSKVRKHSAWGRLRSGGSRKNRTDRTHPVSASP
jgi:hypothetical protein